MSLDLILAALVLALASATAALAAPRASARGQAVSAGLMALSMAVGLTGAGLRLLGAGDAAMVFQWQAAGGSIVGVDALSAFFLVPIFLMGGMGSIYGLGYWPRRRYPRSGRTMEAFWGLLVAGMGLLVIARHAMAFLLGWETMALSAFFLITAENSREENRRAGLVYLIATHAGTLILFGLFLLWRKATGSFAFVAAGRETLGLSVMNALFLLGFLGFGLKAGIMPLHFWLPGAHASSPSHVSAILSGVVLKMGVYGLLRLFLLMEDPPVAWGAFILLAGAVSSLLGVAFALGQHDLKRLLSYHSVENIGIIFMGMGLAMIGRSTGNEVLFVLGLAGALLHVWNHSLFKSLLFLGAGSVLHATGTREIDHLGGLAKPMPWTAAAFLVGAVAICGLPPLNGFVSELLIYLGFFRGLSVPGAGFALGAMAAPVLAATGALAVACFVKAYGAAFLGLPRTEEAERAREAPIAMRLPMLVLAACCVLIGVAPILVMPVLDEVLAGLREAGAPASPTLAGLAPFGAIAAVSAGLALVVALAAAVIFVRSRGRAARASRRPGTWDCGYAAPTARMQYTASSFAQSIVGLFSWVLRPRLRERPVEGCFPGPAAMETEVDEVVLDRLIQPGWRRLSRALGWFRRFQQGLTQSYILFVLVTLMVLLATLIPMKDILARLLAR